MGKNDTRRRAHIKLSEKIADVTLDDYANNPQKLNRARKNKTDFGKIDLVTPIANEPENLSDNDETAKEVFAKDQRIALHKNNNVVGVTYPPDIWFLIAQYIAPEDLGKFALICRDSFYVLFTVQFWSQLYAKFYRTELSIPKELCSKDRKGLRCRVIRLLFRTHPPLVQKILPPVAERYEPYTLQGMKLLLTWHEKEGNYWNYLFKFMSHSVLHHSEEKDLYFNPENGCRVLKVSCSEMICFPFPQHLYVAKVSLGLTSDIRHEKLTLGFSDLTATHSLSKTKSGNPTLVQSVVHLEPVIKCVVLDWWHPEYPHPKGNAPNNNPLCSSDEDEW